MHSNGDARLWEAYSASRSAADRDRLVEYYLPLADATAARAAAHLPPHVDREAIRGDARVALIQAVERFEPKRGLAFSTFAVHRIRGMIFDRLRAADHAPRTVRILQRRRRAAIERLQHALGRPATDEELAEELGWSVAMLERSRVAEQESLSRRVRLGDPGFDEPGSLVDLLVRDEPTPEWLRLDVIEDRTRGLPLAERMIVVLYLRGALMREIGTLLGLSESRVSQLYSRAVRWLARRERGEEAR